MRLSNIMENTKPKKPLLLVRKMFLWLEPGNISFKKPLSLVKFAIKWIILIGFAFLFMFLMYLLLLMVLMFTGSFPLNY